jgi:hypothetical protein
MHGVHWRMGMFLVRAIAFSWQLSLRNPTTLDKMAHFNIQEQQLAVPN